MIEQIRLFERLLDTYKFTEASPDHARSHIISRKRKFFIKLCRTLGIYNLFFSAVVLIFFTAKKLGLSLSVMQSMAALITAAALATGTVTYGGYRTVKSLLDRAEKQELKLPAPLKEKTEQPLSLLPEQAYPVQDKKNPSHTTGTAGPLLAIDAASISSTGINSTSKDRLIARLTKELSSTLPGRISSSPEDSTLYLKGTLIKSGTEYSLYLRLVNPQGVNTASLHYQAKTLQGLMALAPQMASDITGAAR